jgi:hypothetical protein
MDPKQESLMDLQIARPSTGGVTQSADLIKL